MQKKEGKQTVNKVSFSRFSNSTDTYTQAR